MGIKRNDSGFAVLNFVYFCRNIRMEKLNEIIFYNIDKSIRSYRVFAQKNLRKNGFKITIDQWLVIKCIMENPDISQQEMGEIVFKDNASVTRMIELLVKARYLVRKPYNKDRRRVKLVVTDEAIRIINAIHEVSVVNRQKALENVTEEEMKLVNSVMNKIIGNCRTE